MAGSAVASRRTIGVRTKVKTGCATCRIRKIKCDEQKPSCQKCVNTGRTCEGYESLFRTIVNRPVKGTNAGDIKLQIRALAVQPAHIEINSQEIELINRYFSTKTLFDIQLSCHEEARQVLQASLSDPLVRHALLSLRTLREDLEASGDGLLSRTHQTPNYHYGLEQYTMALGGLASNLSSLSFNGLKSALLCCQIFISIEQIRKNYTAMAQHIVRGLRIIHEYRARPTFVATNELLPAYNSELPLVDVFIIKLFAAPCKFADRQETVQSSAMTTPICLLEPHLPGRSHDLRMIAPDMRAQLTRIAQATLEFLSKVSQVESVGAGIQLLSEKADLLDSLASWYNNLERFRKEFGTLGSEPVSVSFMRLFHLVLRIVLLGALDASPNLHDQLRTENDQLQEIANSVTERVRTYTTCVGNVNDQGGPSTVH